MNNWRWWMHEIIFRITEPNHGELGEDRQWMGSFLGDTEGCLTREGRSPVTRPLFRPFFPPHFFFFSLFFIHSSISIKTLRELCISITPSRWDGSAPRVENTLELSIPRYRSVSASLLLRINKRMMEQRRFPRSTGRVVSLKGFVHYTRSNLHPIAWKIKMKSNMVP